MCKPFARLLQVFVCFAYEQLFPFIKEFFIYFFFITFLIVKQHQTTPRV